MNEMTTGMGSLLRALIASLDDGVQQLYRSHSETFRPRYYPVVILLLDHDALRIGELAERCGVSQPAMTQTVAAMRRDGIVRTEDGKDHRARLVSLTAEGKAQAARLDAYWQATARAAAQLEAECGFSISEIAGGYLKALEQRPFIERIKEQLS